MAATCLSLVLTGGFFVYPLMNFMVSAKLPNFNVWIFLFEIASATGFLLIKSVSIGLFWRYSDMTERPRRILGKGGTFWLVAEIRFISKSLFFVFRVVWSKASAEVSYQYLALSDSENESFKNFAVGGLAPSDLTKSLMKVPSLEPDTKSSTSEMESSQNFLTKPSASELPYFLYIKNPSPTGFKLDSAIFLPFNRLLGFFDTTRSLAGMTLPRSSIDITLVGLALLVTATAAGASATAVVIAGALPSSLDSPIVME